MTGPLHFHVQPALRGSSLLLAFEGWNDAGEAATSAVAYLERALRAVPLGELDCEEFLDFTVARPTVRLQEGSTRTVEWPRMRFSYAQIDGTREIALGRGVEPHLRWRGFCDGVVEFAEKVGVRRVVLPGAYLADVVYSRPVDVTGFATSDAVLESIGVRPSAYEGPTGIVGVLAERLEREGLEVVSLWAGLPHYINASPNPRGALALIQKLGLCLDLKVDEEPLRREAAAFEERISALVSEDPELTEYVRQLKRREFAQ